MKTENDKLKAEKIVSLEQGLSIWKIGIDRLREQDKNARVMNDHKFHLLQKTIKKDKRLESLPFVIGRKRIVKMGGDKTKEVQEFHIISGHHRTRAARMAGLVDIYCLVDETRLSRDYVKSKQLAHNAIQGSDDPQILSEIFQSIEDIEAQVLSGITEEDLLKDFKPVNIEEINFEFSTKLVSLLFTNKGFEDFELMLETLKDNSEMIGLADHKTFEPFVKTARQVSKREDVRNMTGIVLKICEIVQDYYNRVDEAVKEKAEQEIAEKGKKDAK